ncbi:hypothetical protein ADL03_00905 [Nocardia sp. NRRL S-836]|nr:hypothetical protein ADL03_00905 [Nocardia sp. NRRL S-836]
MRGVVAVAAGGGGACPQALAPRTGVPAVHVGRWHPPPRENRRSLPGPVGGREGPVGRGERPVRRRERPVGGPAEGPVRRRGEGPVGGQRGVHHDRLLVGMRGCTRG